MASSPLYKKIKSNGTTFYVFPSAAEDISAAYQNSNYKMYFSKYVLLNLPKVNTVSGSGTNVKPLKFDFDNSFRKSQNASIASSFQDQIVESLRNYVANQEVVIRESRLNNTSFYYDTNALETTTEKIFFKWCKKLNIIDFEPAIPDDEYFSNLSDFESNNVNDDEYFPEYLWKERETTPWSPITFSQNGINLEIEFSGTTNLRVGDIVRIYNVSNAAIYTSALVGSNTSTGVSLKILNLEAATSTSGQKIILDYPYTGGLEIETTGKVELVYNKLVRYIGEVNGVSNVQEANRSYTEVYAHIPDHTGETPDILFRTMVDVNYKPNLTFPILPSQIQPEILGAESFNSPIVNSPLDYPGSYFGQFDTLDFTYDIASGDSVRRSGSYFGVNGDINNPIVNGKTIDGITLDFDTSHYVKMNILGRGITNFDQFNALEVNNQPPKAFEFNAILWYYTVEDTNGNKRSNLYGISFLDNPDNDPIDTGLKFPTYKKFVTNGFQDGTSFAFSLNLNFNVINENPQETYNPEAINSMFSMNLFNQAMSRLSSVNDSFLNLIAEQGDIREELNNVKGLLYTQTDLNVLNTKIQNLENLLRLYSTSQIVDSDTISVSSIPGTPPSIMLNSNSTKYERVYDYKSTDMYNEQGIIPINLSVPVNRDFLINFVNNDEVELELPTNDRLTFVLDRDLDLRQSVDIRIIANEFSSQNKKLDIYMRSDISSTTSENTEIVLIGNIDLPIFNNILNNTIITGQSIPNSAFLWKDFKFDIDFTKEIKLLSGNSLEVALKSDPNIIGNSIKVGDTYQLNNLFIGVQTIRDFSGQYTVSSVSGEFIVLDISSNSAFVGFSESESLPLIVHSSTTSMLSNLPYFSLNKGKSIKITRVSNSNVLRDRYSIDIVDLT